MIEDGTVGWDAYAPFYDWENAQTVARRDVAFWQRLALAHEIPARLLNVKPRGFRVRSSVHFDPFHRAPNVAPEPCDQLPTARQLLAEVQTTALSWLLAVPPGAGAVWADQAEPFQRSASGMVPWPFGVLPTAVQADAFEHAARRLETFLATSSDEIGKLS